MLDTFLCFLPAPPGLWHVRTKPRKQEVMQFEHTVKASKSTQTESALLVNIKVFHADVEGVHRTLFFFFVDDEH